MDFLKVVSFIFTTIIVTTVADLHFPVNGFTSSITPTPVQEFDDSFRLPAEITPTHYNIQLRTGVHDAERVFNGVVEIHLKVNQPTDRIVVNSRYLDIESAILYRTNSDPWTEVDQPLITYDELREQLTFQSGALLQLDLSYILRITYSGSLRTDVTAGFFRKYYRDNDGIRHYIAATQFQPIWARQAFPCFDEPAFKTTFTVSLIHHRSYNAVSNMPMEGSPVEDTVDPEFVVSTFMESQRMSTYALAFAVSDFETKSWSLQQILARANAINDTEYALNAGNAILYELNGHLDLSYWNYMPQLVQIAIPDAGTGATETWGLVAFGESSLLYNPEVNDYRSKLTIASTIAHGYVHQWFGNLVTADWWKSIWVHEGIATMYGYYGAHLAYPDQQHMDLFLLHVIQPALAYDASEETHPLNRNVDFPVAIHGLFDAVIRYKSAAVINMLRIILGEEHWRTGVNKYLRNHEMDSATAENFYETLENSTDLSAVFPTNLTVQQFMDNWANAAGYPVVYVRRMYGTTKVIISQDRFLSDRKLPTDHIWYIPYYAEFDSVLNDTLYSWLTTKAHEREFAGYDNDEPLILNGHPLGFYRVNYDSRNWELITTAWIQSPGFIDEKSKAQLIDDAFALARADLLDFGIVLRLLTALKKDSDYLPWATADKVLTYLHDRFRGTEQWGLFKFYVITLVDNHYQTFGQFGEISPNKTIVEKHLEDLIYTWTCRLNIFNCSVSAEEIFQEAVRNEITVHPDIASIVYCNGVSVATNEDFVWMYRRMFDSQNEAERSMFIKAMGCSQNKEQLDAYLTTSIGAGVGSEVNYFDRERLQVVQAVYSASRVGVDALIDFLNNWDIADDFIYWLEQPAFDNAIHAIATRTNTQAEFERLKDLLKTVESLTPEAVVNAAMTTVKANLDWYDSLEALIIMDFLENHANDSASP